MDVQKKGGANSDERSIESGNGVEKKYLYLSVLGKHTFDSVLPRTLDSIRRKKIISVYDE